jgi:hypothetical protein
MAFDSLTWRADIRDLGPDYPAFLQWPGGKRLPLLHELRWSRVYGTRESAVVISRFMDGSAVMSLELLMSGWPDWSDDERVDFAYQCSWLSSREDFADMLRFVVGHGGTDECAGIALSLVKVLPADEAFSILQSLLAKAPPGRRSNFLQAVTATTCPATEELLRKELGSLVAHSGLWSADAFHNWIAHDATCALDSLLRCGVDAEEFDELAKRLARHPCPGNAETAVRSLRWAYPLLDSSSTRR